MRRTPRTWFLLWVGLTASACDQRPTPAGATPAATRRSAPAANDARSPPPPARRVEPTHWSFDAKPATPPSWTVAAGSWQATEQGSLRQVAEGPTQVFNLLLTDQRAKNLTLRVRMRAVSGKIDQGGGVVWRATDQKNYYLVRYNPLEKNVRAYVVERGKRKQLASADVELPGEAWNLLEVRMAGDQLEASINHEKYLELRDSTFTSEGLFGLWTKADAVTEFDDLDLVVLP